MRRKKPSSPLRRGDQVDAGLRPLEMKRKHHVLREAAALRLQAGLPVVVGVLRDDERAGMARAFHLRDRHRRLHIEVDREAAGGARVGLAARGGGERVDVGRPVVIEVEFLVVGDLHLLLGPAAIGKMRISKVR